MSITGIIAIAVAVIFGTMSVTIWGQHQNNARLASKVNVEVAKKNEAIAANKSLAASIAEATKQCAAVEKEYARLTAEEQARQGRAAAAAAAKRKENAGHVVIIQDLEGQAKNPTAKTPEAQCAAADKILKDLNAWRMR